MVKTTPNIQSNVVGAMDCPLYVNAAFDTPNVIMMIMLSNRYPVSLREERFLELWAGFWDSFQAGVRFRLDDAEHQC